MTESRPLTRRDFLRRTSAAAGVGLGLAAVSWESVFAQAERPVLELMFVSTADDHGLSVIDVQREEVVKTLPVGTAFPFPANQWVLTGRHLWGQRGDEVHVVDVLRGEVIQRYPTGSDQNQNYVALTPDGRFAIVAARFTDTFYKISADPQSPDFLQIVARLKTYSGAGPCDMSVTPDGHYAFQPDRHSDAVSVLDIERFEIVAVEKVEPLAAERPDPFMGTVSFDGRIAFIENTEGEGSESIWDLRDRRRPVEVARLTSGDGLGRGPITSEFRRDGRYGFVICRESSSVTVIDPRARRVVTDIALPEGAHPIAGAVTADGSRLYVPLPGRDAVAVIDTERLMATKTILVGPRPLGAVPLFTSLADARVDPSALGAMYAMGRPMPPGCPWECCGPV
jgi:DNA-binding beta-propeller fold protein YncE